MLNKAILILAFFEGVSVMMIELLGGKMLIPYFGNSLIIWTSTIGVTMSSLMIGYFLGGRLSVSKNKLYVLYFMLFICTIWMMIMPSIVKPIIHLFNDAELYSASIMSAIFLFALPLLFFGACPPILISLLANKENAGLSSGKVFGVSTIGSIVCALFVGFVILNKYGISSPMIIYSAIFFFIFSALLWNTFKEKLYFLIFVLPIALLTLSKFKSVEDSNYLYISESLQGQLKVVDEPNTNPRTRYLQINGVNQTRVFMDFNNPIMNQSGWWYAHLDGAIASHKPKGSDVLLMGFGGGSIALELVKLGFNIDVAEIDERLPGIAHDYFLFDTSRVDFYIDDARHFIKKQKDKKKYDLVLIDLLHGEVQPNHVFTKEGLEELKYLLQEDAIVIVNYQSNFDEPQKPFLSILNTFWEANYDAIVAKPQDDRPADYIYIASPNKLPENLFNLDNINECCFNNKYVRLFINNPTYYTKNSQIVQENSPLITLVDDKPILETMNKESIVTWRKHMIEHTEKIKTTVFK